METTKKKREGATDTISMRSPAIHQQVLVWYAFDSRALSFRATMGRTHNGGVLAMAI
jgi:hypothetical protein